MRISDRRMKKNLHIGLSILLSVLLFSCTDVKKPSKAEIEKFGLEKSPDQVSWNIEVFFIDSSYTKAKLNANRGRIYNDEKKTYLDGNVQVVFYSRETGQRTTLMTADSAEIDDRTKNMLARGNVVVYSDSSKTRVETSILHWDSKTQLFYSSEFVKIDSPGEKIQGYGFESDQTLKNNKIFRVSGEQK
jgi:LPS export ABC transporter protein LptC